jgi:hypothetical protein
MRDDRSGKAGDKGIIEEISPVPANLIFASEDVKKQIIKSSFLWTYKQRLLKEKCASIKSSL